MHVAALFRYPLKGFTGEACDVLEILPGGRVAGDRVLGLRFDDATTPDEAWGSKMEFVALINTPALTPLRLTFDDRSLALCVRHGGDVLFDDILDSAGRRAFAASIERYLLSLGDDVLALRARLPLRVVGDGHTPRYQDRKAGYVTLHGRASVASIAAALDEAPDVTERRFRSNVALEGVDAWNEQEWSGHRVRIGDVEFKVAAPVTRCLATHANPLTGARDEPVMQRLLKVYASDRPTFAVLMTSVCGGTIRVGDRVEPAA